MNESFSQRDKQIFDLGAQMGDLIKDLNGAGERLRQGDVNEIDQIPAYRVRAEVLIECNKDFPEVTNSAAFADYMVGLLGQLEGLASRYSN